MEQTIKIKGMACRRCIQIVKDIFWSQNIALRYIKIGEVCYQEKSDTSFGKIEQMLRSQGFSNLDSSRIYDHKPGKTIGGK
jgi:hypothetical protein